MLKTSTAVTSSSRAPALKGYRYDEEREDKDDEERWEIHPNASANASVYVVVVVVVDVITIHTSTNKSFSNIPPNMLNVLYLLIKCPGIRIGWMVASKANIEMLSNFRYRGMNECMNELKCFPTSGTVRP